MNTTDPRTDTGLLHRAAAAITDRLHTTPGADRPWLAELAAWLETLTDTHPDDAPHPDDARAAERIATAYLTANPPPVTPGDAARNRAVLTAAVRDHDTAIRLRRTARRGPR